VGVGGESKVRVCGDVSAASWGDAVYLAETAVWAASCSDNSRAILASAGQVGSDRMLAWNWVSRDKKLRQAGHRSV
jgi:hypothetical protein